MTTLKTIVANTITAMALAPLSPVIILMWTAKGIQILKQKRTESPEQHTIALPAWALETVNYCPSA